MNNNNEADAHQKGEGERADEATSSAATVDIQPSETGSDAEIGHTPGKAEGVSDPEAQGNE